MAGRSSQVDQAAAITRAVQVAPFAAVVRRHVVEVVGSAAFKGSRRSQEFLTFIVEQALNGHFDALKERALGVELFGRSPSYDTGEDAIVRVTASDVRRRLHQFYAQGASEWRIDLPAGSYIPEFHKSEKPVDPKGPEPAALGSTAEANRHTRKWIYLGLVGAFVVVLLWLGRGAGGHAKATQVLPWSAILQNNRDIRIVLCDPDISALQRLFNFNISLSDYANKQFIPAAISLRPENQELASFLRGANVAAVDAALSLAISELAVQNGRRIRTQSARSVQVSDLKTEDNLIVLGSPRSNPWFAYFEKPLHFRFEYDPAGQQEIIINSNVRAGELERYIPTAKGWGTGEAYGTVAFMESPHQSSKVLLLSGTNAEATEAAGKLATNLDLLSKTLRNYGMNQAGVESFQILLKVSTMAGSSSAFDVVACHRLNDK